jgi:UDP-4-amino-4,6-dideoxy-N-acetyl-beta-L-altrosamine transaminase
LIPYGRQNISEADIQAVVQVLQSPFLTQGPAVEHFEQAVAEYCGAKYAIAVSSATAALHIACLAAGLKAGDRHWTSPITFVASANCGLYCGSAVDFVDIHPQTYNLCPTILEAKLKKAQTAGTLPKVVIPVHLAGQSCEMEHLHTLSKTYGFTLIEDASHAIGGAYQGQKIGNGRFSDMTVFSFHPVKIVTTGEGGMILMNRSDLYEKLVRLRSHGITRQQAQMRYESPGPWYYEQLDLGFNYRMTDIQAALGASQMQRIDAFVARRREIVKYYNETLSTLPLLLPFQHPDTASAHHLYIIRLKGGESPTMSHRAVFEQLRAAGIGVNLHYIPVHTQPYYQDLGFRPGDFPQAEAYYREAISLPIYYDLTTAEQDRVIDALSTILRAETLTSAAD